MKRKTHLTFEPTDARHPPGLRRLLADAEVHRQAETRVLAAIPASLADKCRFLSFRDGDLTLSAESSVIASQVRMRQHEILTELRKSADFQFAWRLRVKVSPPRTTPASAAKKELLSKQNARLLEEEAGHTKDEGLREVLEKLSRHIKD
ncbi:DciA family protein [Marinobacter sp. V034]|uniref:DciA family protein n=1 Tax=Marinobacter sp. V034 TaxID=3459610 RepID=UPI004043C29E